MSEPEIIREKLQKAVAYHKSGNFTEAEKQYLEVLQSDPENEDGWHLLGILYYQHEKPAEAVDCLSRASSINPDNPFYQNNLGLMLDSLKRYADAERALQKAVTLKSDYAEAYNNLGVVQKNLGKTTEATESYKKALQYNADFAEALYNLGKLYQQLHRLDEAIEQYNKALHLRPAYGEVLNNMGIIFQQKGNLDEAEQMLRRSLALNRYHPEALNNLGFTISHKKNFKEAESFIRQAISLKPDYPEAYCNLGIVYLNNGNLAGALESLEHLIALAPDYADGYFHLANALLESGRVDAAREQLQKAISFKPDLKAAHSNLLFIMNYSHNADQEAIYHSSVEWDAQLASKMTQMELYPVSCHEERKLRIGYLSGDFREHSVVFFIEPVLRSHDRNGFEIFCYANVKNRDAFTERLQLYADHWIDITGYNDEEIAKRVRDDRIDILVDLAGHSAYNNLLAFACRPAPVQITWLGYPNTTGLRVMDYRLTDAVADPEGVDDRFYSEELVRLPHGFLCFQPDAAAESEVAPLPFMAKGHITFGSFNNIVKVTPEVVKVWSRILQAIPGSRLLLKARQLRFKETVAGFRQLFKEQGVDVERIDFYPMTDSRDKHLKLYSQIDICLDTFPYNGTTTTCEAMWMGVPVVTLAGAHHAGRVGASIMHQAGLEDLVADSIDEYIDLAVSMAKDTESLAEMRQAMREELLASKLMDRDLFTRSLEDTYRQLWKRWCEENKEILEKTGTVDNISVDSTKIDIVIPLIKDNYWEEGIRYVLRSLQKNLQEDFKIHIIGYCPPWCKNVDHIPFQDDPNILKDANLGKKLKLAMQRFKRFIWTHDDIYLISPLNLQDLQVPRVEYDMHSMDRTEGFIQTAFHVSLWKTADRLKELNLTGYYPAAHIPRYFESDKLPKVFELFQVEDGIHNAPFAYFNIYFDGKAVWEQERIGCYSRKDFKRQRDFGSAKFLNHNNDGLSERLKKRIKEMFPEKSRFEK